MVKKSVHPIFGFASNGFLIEAIKLCGGLASPDFEAKKYYPKLAKAWRFICPNPKGMVLIAEEV
jgi:hypothetical protein